MIITKDFGRNQWWWFRKKSERPPLPRRQGPGTAWFYWTPFSPEITILRIHHDGINPLFGRRGM